MMVLDNTPKTYEFFENGWSRDELNCQIVKSPNFDERPAGANIDLVVIHNISLPPGKFGGQDIKNLFLNRLDPSKQIFKPLVNLKVSSHFLIERSGALVQFVSLWDRAWHAGESSFFGRPACNDFSVGIEMEGSDFVEFAEEQYVTLLALIRSIGIFLPDLRAITGHSFIAPSRKTDPGPFFRWDRLKEAIEKSEKKFFLFP